MAPSAWLPGRSRQSRGLDRPTRQDPAINRWAIFAFLVKQESPLRRERGSSLAGAGEDVRRTGEGCWGETILCGAGRLRVASESWPVPKEKPPPPWLSERAGCGAAPEWAGSPNCSGQPMTHECGDFAKSSDVISTAVSESGLVSGTFARSRSTQRSFFDE